MSTAHNVEEWGDDPLSELQSEATRFDREIEQVRSALVQSFEQSLDRLRDTRWVPFELVSRMVEDLTAATDRERTRADGLAADLEAAKREIEHVRAVCELSISSAQEAAEREQEEVAAQFARDLNAAREQARAAAEARLRQEIAAVQNRSQEIVDAQMLQLIEFRRELDQASSAQAERPRADVDQRERAPRPAEPATCAPPLGQGRNLLAPEFAAIEAVLAGSPPVGAWQTGT